MEQEPRVTIVVPTYNRARFVRHTLDGLRRLTPPEGGFEVIVVDDGSSDDTPTVLEGLEPPFRYVRRTNGGPAAARNTGIAEARGEIIAFTDDDCIPSEDWLVNLLEPLSEDDVAGSGGRTVPASTEDVVSRFTARRQVSELPPRDGDEVLWVVTCNAAIRRSVLDEVSGFDEAYAVPGGEDTDICSRIRRRGYRFAVAADALIHHDHTWRNVGQFAGTWFRYGKGDARHLERDGVAFRSGPIILGSLRYSGTVLRHLVEDLRDRIGVVESLRFLALDLLRRWSQTAGIFMGHREISS